MTERIRAGRTAADYLILLLIAAFVWSLLPLLAASVYNRPCADDYTYGLLTRQTFAGTGSFIKTLASAFKTSAGYYTAWQGTFTATFLMSLQPAVFGEKLYSLTAPLMLLMLIAPTFFLLYTGIVRVLGCERRYTIIIGVPMLFMSIQFLPSLVQGFYWYNGAVYYTFYYGLMLVYTALCIRLITAAPPADRKNSARFARLLFAAAALAVIISGGNYVTALITPIITAAFAAAALRRPPSIKIAFAALLALLLTGLFISIAAPGNAVRSAAQQSPGAVRAVVMSFQDALKNIIEWTDLKIIAGLFVLSPAFYLAAEKSGLRFRRPAAVLAVSVCVFAAQYAPPIYAMGWSGDGRLKNIIYFAYIWLVTGNFFYLTGFIGALLREGASHREGPDAARIQLPDSKKRAEVFAAAALIFLVSCYMSMSESSAFISARDVLSGEARQYSAEISRRYEQLTDESVKQAALEPIAVRPLALFFDDITEDKTDWRNVAMAGFYKKESVVLRDDPAD